MPPEYRPNGFPFPFFNLLEVLVEFLTVALFSAVLTVFQPTRIYGVIGLALGYVVAATLLPDGTTLLLCRVEDRRGHCEYFATAFAVMLRSVGVPTQRS